MSHIVTVATQIRDEVAAAAACARLRLPAPVAGEHQLFAQRVTGLGVRLPAWRYPVVCQLATGELHYDNYHGRWGDPRRLDELLQAYAVEKATREARRQGQTVVERQLADGSIRLTLHAGGAAR